MGHYFLDTQNIDYISLYTPGYTPVHICSPPTYNMQINNNEDLGTGFLPTFVPTQRRRRGPVKTRVGPDAPELAGPEQDYAMVFIIDGCSEHFREKILTTLSM